MSNWKKSYRLRRAGQCSVKDYRAIKKAYKTILNQLMAGKYVVRKSVENHYELIKDYEALRYHWLVQFLVWLKIVRLRER